MGLFDKSRIIKILQEKKIDRPLVSGSPGLGGEQERFTKKNERKISKDMEKSINKRLSADLTRGDQARAQYGTDGGYGDSNVGDATVNKSLKKGKPFTKAESDAIQIRSLNKKTKQFVNKPGTTKSKGPGASTGGQKNLVVNPKSKGTTPVTVSTTKTIKQSEQSKKAKTFTKKINKANKNRKEFPGDKSGAYQAAKSDLEARKGFKGAKTQTGAGKTKTITGLKADEKNPFVKRSVRKTRVDKLGGDIYDQPNFSQKTFERDLKNTQKAGDKSFKSDVKKFKKIGLKPPKRGDFTSKSTPGGKQVISDPFKGATGKASQGSILNKFKFTPRDRSASQLEKKAAKSFSQFKKDLAGQGVDIKIEKQIQRSSKISNKIGGDSGASSGGKSKGKGSRTTNTSNYKQGNLFDGGSSTGGGGSKPPKPPKGSGGSIVPPGGGSGGSGGSGGIDPEIVRGKFKETGKGGSGGSGNMSDKQFKKFRKDQKKMFKKFMKQAKKTQQGAASTVNVGRKTRSAQDAINLAKKIKAKRTPTIGKALKGVGKFAMKNPGKAGLIGLGIVGGGMALKSYLNRRGDLNINKDFAKTTTIKNPSG